MFVQSGESNLSLIEVFSKSCIQGNVIRKTPLPSRIRDVMISNTKSINSSSSDSCITIFKMAGPSLSKKLAFPLSVNKSNADRLR